MLAYRTSLCESEKSTDLFCGSDSDGAKILPSTKGQAQTHPSWLNPESFMKICASYALVCPSVRGYGGAQHSSL